MIPKGMRTSPVRQCNHNCCRCAQNHQHTGARFRDSGALPIRAHREYPEPRRWQYGTNGQAGEITGAFSVALPAQGNQVLKAVDLWNEMADHERIPGISTGTTDSAKVLIPLDTTRSPHLPVRWLLRAIIEGIRTKIGRRVWVEGNPQLREPEPRVWNAWW